MLSARSVVARDRDADTDGIVFFVLFVFFLKDPAPPEISPLPLPAALPISFWLRAIYAGRRIALQPEPYALYRWGDSGLAADSERMDEHASAVLRKAAPRN